jgi:hypothetical protein
MRTTKEGVRNVSEQSPVARRYLVCGTLLVTALLCCAQKPSPEVGLIVVSTWILSILALRTGVLAMALAYLLVAPGGVRQSSRVLQQRPIRTLLIGLGSLVIILLVTIMLGSLPKGPRAVLFLILVLLVLLLVLHGLSACFLALGEQLHANTFSPHAGSSFRAAFHGGLLLSLPELVPGVGQIMGFLVLLCALGASTCSLWHGRRPALADDAPEAAAPQS